MASNVNLFVDQGSSYSKEISITNADGTAEDLTGFTFEGHIKTWYDVPTSVPFDIQVSGSTLIIGLSDAATAAMTPRRYVYSVNMSNGAFSKRVLSGVLMVSPDVTGS